MLNLASGPWMIVNDGVMGGRSEGQIETTPDGMRFSGHLSLENNGGFSSTRRMLENTPGGCSGVRLEARGDGRSFQLRLRQGSSFDGVSWSATFPTDQRWQTVSIPFSKFEPVFRGNKVPQAGPVDPAQVSQIGFLIGDRREGAFELEVRNMHFYADETGVQRPGV
jgi:monofunctional biosynthetic peptidoglycan transglycosylase